VIDDLVDKYTDTAGHPADWDMDDLAAEFAMVFFARFKLSDEQMNTLPQDGLRSLLIEVAKKAYLHRASLLDPEVLSWNERVILLSTIDEFWKEHLYEMDHLKEGIGLRGYGQRDPLVEYKREGYLQFEQTIGQINTTTLKTMFRGMSQAEVERADRPRSALSNVNTSHEEYGQYDVKPPASDKAAPAPTPPPRRPGEKREPVKRDTRKVGRNEPCPCGSGKKYKHCCGKQ